MTKKIKLKELKAQYEFVCNQYIKKFCKKQELDFNGWVADEVGGIAEFANQYFFNISEIMLDMNTKQPAGLILDWQTDGVEAYFKNETVIQMNYNSYIKGLRYSDLVDINDSEDREI